jgi:hypothetical protein
MQLAILIINSFVVFFNLTTIAIKVLMIFLKSEKLSFITDNEYLLSFLLDLVIGIMGGISYFRIDEFTTWLGAIIGTSCLDNYTQYQFGVFNESLEGTRDQNLQLFLFVLFKCIIIFCFTVVYMLYRKCNFTRKTLWRVVKDNINEGESNLKFEDVDNMANELKMKRSNVIFSGAKYGLESIIHGINKDKKNKEKNDDNISNVNLNDNKAVNNDNDINANANANANANNNNLVSSNNVEMIKKNNEDIEKND